MDDEIGHVARDMRVRNGYPFSRKTWDEKAA